MTKEHRTSPAAKKRPQDLISGGAPKEQDLPDKSEADIQAEIWEVVRSHGFECRLEYSVVNQDAPGRGATCRVDVVGFSAQTPVVVFEVKTPETNKSKCGNYMKMARRVTRYFNNGLPAAIVQSPDEADDFIRRFVL